MAAGKVTRSGPNGKGKRVEGAIIAQDPAQVKLLANTEDLDGVISAATLAGDKDALIFALQRKLQLVCHSPDGDAHKFAMIDEAFYLRTPSHLPPHTRPQTTPTQHNRHPHVEFVSSRTPIQQLQLHAGIFSATSVGCGVWARQRCVRFVNISLRQRI